VKGLNGKVKRLKRDFVVVERTPFLPPFHRCLHTLGLIVLRAADRFGIVEVLLIVFPPEERAGTNRIDIGNMIVGPSYLFYHSADPVPHHGLQMSISLRPSQAAKNTDFAFQSIKVSMLRGFQINTTRTVTRLELVATGH
jgi:hypothetical protein